MWEHMLKNRSVELNKDSDLLLSQPGTDEQERGGMAGCKHVSDSKPVSNAFDRTIVERAEAAERIY